MTPEETVAAYNNEEQQPLNYAHHESIMTLIQKYGADKVVCAILNAMTEEEAIKYLAVIHGTVGT